MISVVYALPTTSSSMSMSTSMSMSMSTTQPHYPPSPPSPKGIVLLLHACSHSAYKFFSPSILCPQCIGLAEELELVRRVLEKNYIALAVSCNDVSRSGCWSPEVDVERVLYSIQQFLQHSQQRQQSILFTTTTTTTTHIPIFAIGASSGGYMAARLLLPQKDNNNTNEDGPFYNDSIHVSIDAALIMVMGLSQSIQNRLKNVIIEQPSTSTDPNSNSNSNPTKGKRGGKRIYFAPMIKDTRTTQIVRNNVQALRSIATSTTSLPVNNVILDETSCQPLPVNVDYLWNKVVGMTKEAAQIIVSTLRQAGHIHTTTGLLIVDPTQSNWRQIVLATVKDHPIPESLKQTKSSSSFISSPSSQQQQQHYSNSSTFTSTSTTSTVSQFLLWGIFDLTPGRSPLAKALHRAWAYHEYCSEAVDRALDWFETNDETMI
jgi:hypothetical protein